MTEDEVRYYLDQYIQVMHGTQCEINALRRYASRYDKYLHIPEIYGTVEGIYERCRKLKAEMDDKSRTVIEWEKLIRSDRRRAIFHDRYIERMLWDDIELKHHYCASTIFRIHNKCIRDIAEMTRTNK